MNPIPRVIPEALLCAVVVALNVHSIQPSQAQEWPTRAVTMVVPFSAGGTTDVVARILNPGLSEKLGQQVIVENISGAGGMMGTSRVAKASPDGYQFVLGNVGTHAQNQSIYKDPLYNAAVDFVPVVLLVDQPMLLIVRKDLPAANLPEFVIYARANQTRMQYGSAGAGSPTHLACALLNAAIGINVMHVPYRGGGPAMQDLIAGRIDYFCFNTASIIPHLESKTLRALAMLSKDRSPALPHVATAGEQGLKDFEVANWLALFLPKGSPKPIVQRLHDAAVATLNNSELQEKLKRLGAEPVAAERRTQAYLQQFVDSEIMKWSALVKAANIKVE